MYRFVATPRWLGLALLFVVLAGTMVWLGDWQLARFHVRSAINARIDAATQGAPVPITSLSRPGVRPAGSSEWAKVAATGEYDAAHVILVRDRTVTDQVGFEVLTPLRQPDGSAVLVDRGWIPPAAAGFVARPDVPPLPTGRVTVIGRLRLPESHPFAVEHRYGGIEVRRISPAQLARELPYPVYGAWMTVDQQAPANDPRFVAAQPVHENSWMNAAYVVQWWLFAGLTLVAYGWLVRREAQIRSGQWPQQPRDRVPAPPEGDAAHASTR